MSTHTIATEIVKHLEGWTLLPLKDDTNSHYKERDAKLKRDSDGLVVDLYGGATIRADFDTPKRGEKRSRWAKFASVSPTYHSAYGWNADNPAINFSAKRKPEIMAREIMRRLVTPNETHVASMFAQLKEEADHDAKSDASIERIKAAGIPLQHRRNGSGGDAQYAYIGPLEIEMSAHGSIRLTGHMNYLTEEQAIAVHELFKARGWTKRSWEI